MHKIGIRIGATWVERWVARSHGRRIDWLDCEGYQVGGAKLIGAEFAPTLTQLETHRAEVREGRALVREAAAKQRDGSRYGRGDGRPFIASRRR